MKNRKLLNAVAYLNLFAAIGIILFWIGFYTEMIFPINTLSPKIANFQGYYRLRSIFISVISTGQPRYYRRCVAQFGFAFGAPGDYPCVSILIET